MTTSLSPAELAAFQDVVLGIRPEFDGVVRSKEVAMDGGRDLVKRYPVATSPCSGSA